MGRSSGGGGRSGGSATAAAGGGGTTPSTSTMLSTFNEAFNTDNFILIDQARNLFRDSLTDAQFNSRMFELQSSGRIVMNPVNDPIRRAQLERRFRYRIEVPGADFNFPGESNLYEFFVR